MSQTDALAWRVTQELKTEFSSIGTGILKVCECPEIVTEQWNGLGRAGVFFGTGADFYQQLKLDFSRHFS